MDTDFGHLGTSASAAVQVESSTHAHPWMPYLHSTHTHTWQIKRFSNILNNGAWNTKIKSSGSAGTGPSAALEAHESTTHMNFLLLLLLLFFFILLFFFLGVFAMATSAPENLLAHITYYSCSFPWEWNWNGKGGAREEVEGLRLRLGPT